MGKLGVLAIPGRLLGLGLKPPKEVDFTAATGADTTATGADTTATKEKKKVELVSYVAVKATHARGYYYFDKGHSEKRTTSVKRTKCVVHQILTC